MQTDTPKPNKARVFPVILIGVFFVLLFVPGVADLRGLCLGLIAGLAFSFYPPLLACGVTILGVAVGAFFGQADWLAFAAELLTALPLCILLGCFFRKPPEPAVFLLSALLTETAGLGATVALASRRAGESVLDRFFEEMSTTLSAALNEMAAAGMFPEEAELDALQTAVYTLVETYRLRVPFFLLIGAAAIALLLFLAILWMRRACGMARSPLPPFRFFRLNKPAAVLILVSFVGSLFVSGTVATAFENLYTFLTFIMVVSGLAYTAYWLTEKGLGVALRGLVLTGGALISLFFPLLWYLLLMLGLTDSLWDLRALRLPGRKE